MKLTSFLRGVSLDDALTGCGPRCPPARRSSQPTGTGCRRPSAGRGRLPTARWWSGAIRRPDGAPSRRSGYSSIRSGCSRSSGGRSPAIPLTRHRRWIWGLHRSLPTAGGKNRPCACIPVVPAKERVRELKDGWVGTVRPSRQPRCGFLRMRRFLNAINNVRHGEERRRRVSNHARRPYRTRPSAFAGMTEYGALSQVRSRLPRIQSQIVSLMPFATSAANLQ